MIAFYEVSTGIRPENGAQMAAASMRVSMVSQFDGYVIAYQEQGSQKASMFNAAPTPSMTRLWENLQTMERQVYTNIIYGRAPIGSFDQFVQDWLRNGGEAITREVNEWYRSVR
jgi:putative aldouronate transport system substrate-binding protein